jgi:PPM family protein phosphatase
VRQRSTGDIAIMKVAAKSDLGRVRTTNEDCLLTDERLGLLMVADGMGGHAGGEVASAMAIATITSYVQGQLRGPARFAPPAVLLQAAIRAADEVIWTQARTSRQLRGMGTTVVVALCQGAQVHLAHVGDSRAYLLQGGRLRQLTEDHSVVAQLLKAGQLTHATPGPCASPAPSDHAQCGERKGRCGAALRHLATRRPSAAVL